MKNKFLLAASSSVIAGALLMNLAVGTAFAQTTPTTPAPTTTGAHAWSGRPGGPMGMKPAVFGTVSAISGDSITLTSKMGGPRGPAGSTSTNTSTSVTTTTYTVDATNATVMKNNATSTLSSVAVGDTVVVQGTISGTNVAATMIRDGVMPMMGGRGGIGKGPGGPHGTSTPMTNIQGNGQPVIGGTVSAINGSSLTVVTSKGNITYTVDASNATVDKGNTSSSVSSIAVGDNVVVQGTVNGTAVTASSVIDQGAPKTTTSTGPKAMVGGFMGAVGGFFQHLFGFF